MTGGQLFWVLVTGIVALGLVLSSLAGAWSARARYLAEAERARADAARAALDLARERAAHPEPRWIGGGDYPRDYPRYEHEVRYRPAEPEPEPEGR